MEASGLQMYHPQVLGPILQVLVESFRLRANFLRWLALSEIVRVQLQSPDQVAWVPMIPRPWRHHSRPTTRSQTWRTPFPAENSVLQLSGSAADSGSFLHRSFQGRRLTNIRNFEFSE